MGFNFYEFMDLTWREFAYYSKGYERREEKKWNFIRNLIASNFNSSGFSKKSVSPTDVMKLPTIDGVNRKKAPLRKVSDEAFKKLTAISKTIENNG